MVVNAAARLTTAERLAGIISEDILAGRLAPGVPLREEELGRLHGASRNLVREALRIVVADGLAIYEAFKGARVSHVSVDDVRDIYRTRAMFELGALPFIAAGDCQLLAAVHRRFTAAVAEKRWSDAFALDRDFHGTIVAACGSQRMVEWHRELFQVLSRAHLVCPEYEEEGFRASVEQHGQILDALAAGDVPAAGEALAAHLAYSESLLTKGTAPASAHPQSEASR